MGRVILILCLVCAPVPAWCAEGQPPAEAPPKIRTKLEGRLWRALVKCEGALDESKATGKGCLDKLAIRQPDVVTKLVVPAPVQTEAEGFSVAWVVVAGAVGVGLGVVIGIALAGAGGVQPIVVR